MTIKKRIHAVHKKKNEWKYKNYNQINQYINRWLEA